mgnify:CR=1 FL=1
MLDGRVYIVTGGATGIGAGIMRVLTSYGARVAVIQPELIEGTSMFRGDVREPSVWFDDVVSKMGRLDGLVNNAAITGAIALAPFIDASREHIDQVRRQVIFKLTG